MTPEPALIFPELVVITAAVIGTCVIFAWTMWLHMRLIHLRRVLTMASALAHGIFMGNHTLADEERLLNVLNDPEGEAAFTLINGEQ